MKNPILRGSVLICSVSLAAGFVAYSGGAFNGWFTSSATAAAPAGEKSETAAPKIISGSKSSVMVPLNPGTVVIPSSKSDAIFTPADRTIMFSSKSGAIAAPKPAATAPTTTTSAAPPRTVLSGSKTFVITPPEPAQPAVIMGGSKSKVIISPAPAPSPSIMGSSKSIIIAPKPPAPPTTTSTK